MLRQGKMRTFVHVDRGAKAGFCKFAFCTTRLQELIDLFDPSERNGRQTFTYVGWEAGQLRGQQTAKRCPYEVQKRASAKCYR